MPALAMHRFWLAGRYLEWRHMRSLRPGSVGRALVRDVLTGNSNHLEGLVREALPQDWHVSLALLRAGHELLELTRAFRLNREAGVVSPIAARLAMEIEPAAQALGRTADRLACVAAQHVYSIDLARALDSEARRLAEFTETTRKIREDLARALVVSHPNPDLTESQAAMRSLCQPDLIEFL